MMVICSYGRLKGANHINEQHHDDGLYCETTISFCCQITSYLALRRVRLFGGLCMELIMQRTISCLFSSCELSEQEPNLLHMLQNALCRVIGMSPQYGQFKQFFFPHHRRKHLVCETCPHLVAYRSHWWPSTVSSTWQTIHSSLLSFSVLTKKTLGEYSSCGSNSSSIVMYALLW